MYNFWYTAKSSVRISRRKSFETQGMEKKGINHTWKFVNKELLCFVPRVVRLKSNCGQSRN